MLGFDDFPFTKQEGYAPDTGDRHQCIKDPADGRTLSAKGPGDDIKAEKADTAPIEGTDNDKNQCQSV